MSSQNKESPEVKQLQAFKDRIIKEAEQILHNVFPKKVLELDNLLLSETFKVEPDSIRSDLNIPVPAPHAPEENGQSDGAGEPPGKRARMDAAEIAKTIFGTPVYSLPNGSAPANAKLVALMDVLKPLLKELIEYTNKMKMWILFLIPKIEDGNNFGVSIQEDTLAEVRQIEAETAQYLDQCTRYYVSRAKIITKVAKYPHVEDYRNAVVEMDEKQLLQIRLTLAELRNSYSSLHDLIIKNLDKIVKPRTANQMHMY